jgi:hypothetical protein
MTDLKTLWLLAGVSVLLLTACGGGESSDLESRLAELEEIARSVEIEDTAELAQAAVEAKSRDEEIVQATMTPTPTATTVAHKISTATPSPIPVPTQTPTVVPSSTATPSPIPTQSPTPRPTRTPRPTSTPAPTGPTSTPRPTATPTPQARNLVNLDWGYSIEVQAGWEVDDSDKSSMAFRWNSGVFYVFSENWSEAETLQSYADLIWDFRAGQKLPDTVQSVLVIEEIQLPTGLTAIRRIWDRPGYTTEGDLVDYRFMSIVVRAGGNGYEMYGVAPQADWATYEPRFDDFVAAFNVVNIGN